MSATSSRARSLRARGIIIQRDAVAAGTQPRDAGEHGRFGRHVLQHLDHDALGLQRQERFGDQQLTRES